MATTTQEMVAPAATAPINIASNSFLGENLADSGYESSWPSLLEAAAWSPPSGQKRLVNVKPDQDLSHLDCLGSNLHDKDLFLLSQRHTRYSSHNKKRNEKRQLQHSQKPTQIQEVQGQQQQPTRQGKGQRRRAKTQACQAKRMVQQATPLVDLSSPIMEEDDPHTPDLTLMEPPIPLSVIPRGWLYEDVSSSLAEDVLIALPKREWIYESAGPMPMDAKSFVVMSWNLLSPRLCHPLRLDVGCEPVFLEWAYRREAILNQIAFTDADIVCLQELELRDYEDYFCPHMTRLGFKSIHAYKINVCEMRDGCAIFYRDSRFKLVDEHVLRFNQVELDDYNVKRPSMARDTAIRFNLFHNLAIVALFENKRTKRQVQVATTHLLADPAFPDAKMLQTAILTSKLEELKSEAIAKLSTVAVSGNNSNSSSSMQRHIPTILAGDFNSLPDSSVVRFLKSGQVDTCHFGGNDFGRFTRAHSKYFYHRLGLADSYKSSILPFTNATRHFQGTIDYLLYDPSSLGLVGFLDHFEADPIWAAASATNTNLKSRRSSSMSTIIANMSSSDFDSELEQDLASTLSCSSLDSLSSPLLSARGKHTSKKALKKLKNSSHGLDFSKLLLSDPQSTSEATLHSTTALTTATTTTVTESTRTKKYVPHCPIRATLPTALPSQYFPSDHIPLVAQFRERECLTATPTSSTPLSAETSENH